MEKKEYNILSIHEFGKQNKKQKKMIKKSVGGALLNSVTAVACFFLGFYADYPALLFVASGLNAISATNYFIMAHIINNENNELINTQVRELNEKLIDTENRLLVYKK